MPQRLVYFNGSYVSEQDARISIFDSALMFGDMVFEMTRSFKQKPYRLRNHMDRLYASMKYARIDCGLNIEEMESATEETIERNLPALEGLDYQIMHNVTRGALPLYDTLVTEGVSPVVTINVIPLVRHIGGAAHDYEQGAHFVVTPQQSVPARYIDPKAKNRSRIYYQLANLQAQRHGNGRQRPAHRRTRVHHRGHRKQRLLRPQRGGPDAQGPTISCGGVSRQVCMETRQKAEYPCQ